MDIPDSITKNAVEQYEKIRGLGPCNMFDYNCVMNYAGMMGLIELSDLNKDDYIFIISNYSDLLDLFNISRNEDRRVL